MNEMLSKKIVPYALVATMAFSACGKKSECEIPTRHVHKYTKQVTDDITIEKYLDNEHLVYKFATKYYLLKNEDMMQSLKMAMYRAIVSYDESKGYALSTYIYKVLYNEYCYHFRDKNLKIKYTSNIVTDKNGKSSDIFDFIADDKNKNIDYELDKKEMLNIINNYINTLEKQDKDMFIDYYFNGVKQKHLAKKYSLSQGQISRNLKNIISCLQELLKDYK